MLKSLSKKFIHRTYKPLLQWYLKNDRPYKYQGVKIRVMPGVFHPGLFFSTKIMLDFISRFDLKDKTLLELGCGTGLISIYAAGQGAKVTATDISQQAVENTIENAKVFRQNVEKGEIIQPNVFQSDLFERIELQHFDFIIINPPYYPKDAENDAQKAWYCGTDHGYFQKLFPQIIPFIQRSQSFMILSEDCDIERISAIARENHLRLTEIFQKKVWYEKNFIFKIEKSGLE